MEICRLHISLLSVVSSVSIQDPGWNSTQSARDGKEHRAPDSAYQDELCPVAGRELGKDKGCAQDHTSVVMTWPLPALELSILRTHPQMVHRRGAGACLSRGMS